MLPGLSARKTERREPEGGHTHGSRDVRSGHLWVKLQGDSSLAGQREAKGTCHDGGHVRTRVMGRKERSGRGGRTQITGLWAPAGLRRDLTADKKRRKSLIWVLT